MKKIPFCLSSSLLILILALSSCNLPFPFPKLDSTPTPTATALSGGMYASTAESTTQQAATPPSSDSLCDNDYFPSDDDTTWVFSGNNSKTGAYTRTDTVTASSDYGFTITTQLTKVNYTQEFTCTEAGLINLNPATGELTSMLSGPSGTVLVNRLYNSGITIPKDLDSQVGQLWQQVFRWEANSSDATNTGEFTYYFTAMGLEVVQVPLGTFDAMRIDANIEVEIGTFQKMSGTYKVSIWLVKNIGLVKSEGSMKMSGVDFNDSMELTSYDSP